MRFLPRPQSRHWLATAACALALAAVWLPAAAPGADGVPKGHTASFDRCHNQFNFMSVPMASAQIRDGNDRNDRVPEHYRVRSDTNGATANLLVDLFRCDVTVGGTVLPSPTRMAAVAFELQPDPADHGPADNGTPSDFTDDPIQQDFYLLFLVTDGKQLADWWRAGTGLSAYYVPGLRYDYTLPEPSGVAPFSFDAPSPTPSPFQVRGTAGAQHERPVYVEENRWQDTKTPDGKTWRVKLTFPYHASYVSPAEVTVTAATGSEMHTILAPAGWPSGTPYPAQPAFPGAARMDHLPQLKSVSRECTPAETAAELAGAQQGVFAMLDRGTPDKSDDLTTLRDEGDLADLAALGYNFYPHHQTSLEGMAWPVLDTFTDPSAQTAERPQLLFYAPTPPPPPAAVTKPRDGFDFPYRLRGWGYVPLSYDYAQHPVNIPRLQCIGRKQWFVHERGIHTFDDGGFDPYPPEEELRGLMPHGTARGDDTVSLTPKLQPGDFPHGRSWDLHVWCSPDCIAPKSDVPTVSMLNPGTPIPGLDPNVGVSPPPNWPDPPYPSFFYPPE